MLSARHLELGLMDMTPADFKNLELVRDGKFVFRNLEDIEAFRRLFKKCLVDASDEDHFPSGEIGIKDDGQQILGSIERSTVGKDGRCVI